jgi:hypothetical protein
MLEGVKVLDRINDCESLNGSEAANRSEGVNGSVESNNAEGSKIDVCEKREVTGNLPEGENEFEGVDGVAPEFDGLKVSDSSKTEDPEKRFVTWNL